MVMNHKEGYRLFPKDDETVQFRVTATKGTHVKGPWQPRPLQPTTNRIQRRALAGWHG